MGKDERKRQQKLAKKRSKDNHKAQELARRKQQMQSAAEMMKLSSRGEITSCLLCDDSHREMNGMVTVFLARRAHDGRLAFANYLVDCWCLGVKDVQLGIQSPGDVREMLEELKKNLQINRCQPERGRAIVEGGVAYAASLGLQPHPDYAKAKWLWGDVDVSQNVESVEFGFQGSPLYMPGPFEDDVRRTQVVASLQETVGDGNFTFRLNDDDLQRLGR